MTHSFLRCIRTLVLMTLALTAPIPSRAGEAGAVLPLELLDGGAKGGIALSWRQLAEGTAVVPVFNSSTNDLRVVAQPVVLAPLHPTSGFASAGFSVTLSPATATVQANRSSYFKVDGVADKPAPGVYVGGVVLSDGDGKPVLARQTLVITVSAVPEPLLQSNTVVLYRLIPLGKFSPWWPDEFAVPLAVPGAMEGLAGRTVGAVRRDAGGWTSVHWKESKGNPPVAQPKLIVNNPPSAGKYEGALNLADESAKSAITLTVIAKDIVFWPLLVIFLGIAMAFLAKRYIGVLRVTWTLRLQEAELGEAFGASQKRFAEQAAGEPFGTYSIAEDFEAQRRALRDGLGRIESSLSTTLDGNTTYSDALTKLQTLQTAPTLWAGFATELTNLDEALTGLRSGLDAAAMEPPDQGSPEPTFLAAAQVQLRGRAITLAELSTLRASVLERAALAKTWATARQSLADSTAGYRELRGAPVIPAAIAPQITALGNTIIGLWVSLRNVADTAGMSAVLAGGGIAQVMIQVQQLRAQLGVLALIAPSPVRLGMLAASDRLADLKLPANDQRRAEFLRESIARWDGLSFGFAMLLATLTGLNALYIGQPFGSVKDYVILFLWAAGTKATLDMVTVVIDKFTQLDKRG